MIGGSLFNGAVSKGAHQLLKTRKQTCISEKKPTLDWERPQVLAGMFTGEVIGDYFTQAAVSVTLKQQDNKVDREITMGRGLKLDLKGFCAEEPVDLVKIPISGTTDTANPLHLLTSTQVKEPTTKSKGPIQLKFVTMNVQMDATLINEGQSMSAKITLKAMETDPKVPLVLLTCKSRELPVLLKRSP